MAENPHITDQMMEMLWYWQN